MAPSPDSSDVRPVIPDTSGIIDRASPFATTYRLPERADYDDCDGLVLALDSLEIHVSRLRFQLYLEGLLRVWPDGLVAVRLSYHRTFVEMQCVTDWGASPEGLECPHPQKDQAFRQLVDATCYREDGGFVLLCEEHLEDKSLGPAALRVLIDRVIPPKRRAALRKATLQASLEPTATARPGPRL